MRALCSPTWTDNQTSHIQGRRQCLCSTRPRTFRDAAKSVRRRAHNARNAVSLPTQWVHLRSGRSPPCGDPAPKRESHSISSSSIGIITIVNIVFICASVHSGMPWHRRLPDGLPAGTGCHDGWPTRPYRRPGIECRLQRPDTRSSKLTDHDAYDGACRGASTRPTAPCLLRTTL
jgi:hypothetical protein